MWSKYSPAWHDAVFGKLSEEEWSNMDKIKEWLNSEYEHSHSLKTLVQSLSSTQQITRLWSWATEKIWAASLCPEELRLPNVLRESILLRVCLFWRSEAPEEKKSIDLKKKKNRNVQQETRLNICTKKGPSLPKCHVYSLVRDPMSPERHLFIPPRLI